MRILSVSLLLMAMVGVPGLWLQEPVHTGSSQAKILRHVVLFDFNGQASDSVLHRIGRDLSDLEKTVRQIQDLEWGANIRKNNEYTHCLLVSFNSIEGLQKYNDHPDHQAIAKKYGKYIEKVTEVDYWHLP